MSDKPNIVFIMVDQLPAAFLGCYGNELPVTPTLDQVAKKGMLFSRYYSSMPLCSPNRATVFTGRSSQVHGVFSNNYNLQADTPTLFSILKKSGYRTGGFGKFHLTTMGQPLPDDFAYLGFDESIATEDPKLGPWLDWIKREYPDDYETALAVTWPMEYSQEYGKKREDLFTAITAARKKILDPIRTQSSWECAYPSPLRKELHQSTWITDISLDFMERHLQEHSGQPFCSYISYVDPHDPYDPPAPYDTMFDPDKISTPLPAAWPVWGCDILEKSKAYLDFNAVENDEKTIKKARALYLGSMRFVDDQIARIMIFLDEHKLIENTVIVFTSDHGDMIGDHSLPGKGSKHFDKSIHCPLIAAGPGIIPGNSRELVCSLDFFPTFCDLAKLDHLPPLEGKSFAPLLRGDIPANSREEVTVDYCTETVAVRSIITADGWRFTIFDEDNTGEMYDLGADPDEQCNLFYDPKYAAKKFHLYERLTRAYMNIAQIPQYRNLPEENGYKHYLKPHSMGYPGEKILY